MDYRQDYRADYADYRPRYRSSSQPPRSSGYDGYGGYDGRSRSRYSDYRDDYRHSTGYALQPAGYSRDQYDGPLKEYYRPRNTYNYLPPQYNSNGHYTDYMPTRRSAYNGYDYTDQHRLPYTSPMGYKTRSDRQRTGELADYWGSAAYWDPRYTEPGPYQTIDEMLGRLYNYDYNRPCEMRLERPLYQPLARSGLLTLCTRCTTQLLLSMVATLKSDSATHHNFCNVRKQT
jgi:hypothetical protein